MKRSSEQGQSLLVIVLLIAVVFTLIASASYRLTTETQSSKIQEETVRTLAAADSGVEKGLELLSSTTTWPKAFNQIGINLPGVDTTQSTVNITSAAQSTFTTNIPANEQYTFYLYEYPNGTTYFNNDMVIALGQGSDACGAGRTLPVLELTLMYGTNQINKWLVEPCTVSPNITYGSGTVLTINSGTGGYLHNIPFNDLSSYTNPRLLIIRSLYAEANIQIRANTGTFPIQGQTITSTAISTTGVSKVVTLFRSYPQIPADFFVTTF